MLRKHQAVPEVPAKNRQPRKNIVAGGRLWGLRAKFLQDIFTQEIGIVLAGLGKFDDALRDNFVGEIAPVRKAKRRANHFECHPHDALGLGGKRHFAQVRSYRHGALLHSQAGARPVSQPSAPDQGSLPMIGYPMPPTRTDSRLTDSAAPKLLEGAAWKFKPRPTGVEPVRGSAPSEPLSGRVRPRVVRALTPVASAGRGRERRVAVRALFGSRRRRGFVSLRRAQP